MLFSQLALIVLVVMAMATGYVPWWLGALTIVVWAAAKLVMRGVITQVERRELETHRMAGSRLDVHGVERLAAEEADADALNRYWLDLTVAPPNPETEWVPLKLEAFEIKGDLPRSCAIESCMVWRDDGFVPCSESVRGTARVRLLIEAMPVTKLVVLAHEEERLGTVSLRN